VAVEIVSCDGAVFALWGKPTKADIDRVVDELKAVAAKAGEPVVYIARVPSQAPPPDADVRQYTNSKMPECAALCSSYHVALEGSGFFAAVKRAVLAGLFQVAWRKGAFFMHPSPKDVPAKLDRNRGLAANKVLALAEAHGLLSKALAAK
jgi:hypothetical protein